MKRNFNVFDALFILALYFKLSGTGPAVAWWEVFSPYMVEVLYVLLVAFFGMVSMEDRVRYFLWRIMLNKKVKQAGKQAADYVKSVNSNPGSVTDKHGRANDGA